MRKLDHITVRNFKSIRELELDLHHLNIFIGANGVGKSNFIEIFDFLNHILEKKLQRYTAEHGGADSLLHFGRKRSEYLELKLAFAGATTGYDIRLAPTVDDTFFFDAERVWFHKQESDTTPSIQQLGEGHKESLLSDYAERTESIIADVMNWRIYHFHDTSDSARIKQTGDLEDNNRLHSDAGNLAAFLYRLEQKHPDHFANIVAAIKMVAPFFDTFQLRPSRLNEQKIRLEWKEKGSDKYFNASSLSDGTLRFMCLATLLLQPELPSMIILDEPELGLHPAAIVLLADFLRQAAAKTQVLVATQSVTLVNQFVPEDIIVLEREGGQSTFKHLAQQDMQAWLDEYGIGDLWEKNVLGGRP